MIMSTKHFENALTIIFEVGREENSKSRTGNSLLWIISHFEANLPLHNMSSSASLMTNCLLLVFWNTLRPIYVMKPAIITRRPQRNKNSAWEKRRLNLLLGGFLWKVLPATPHWWIDELELFLCSRFNRDPVENQSLSFQMAAKEDTRSKYPHFYHQCNALNFLYQA